MNSQAIKNLKKTGIACEGSIMIGLPTETVEDIKLTYKFVRDNKMDNGGIKIFQPFPKTKLWDYCIEKGLIKDAPKSTEEWAARYRGEFNTVVYNVSDAPEAAIMRYQDIINKEFKKGILLRKILNYARNRRFPHYQKIISNVKHYLRL